MIDRGRYLNFNFIVLFGNSFQSSIFFSPFKISSVTASLFLQTFLTDLSHFSFRDNALGRINK